MATVKKANVPATHPTVYVGLALAVVGLLLAMYAYTGTRVYDIVFAFVAIGGAVVALAGILLAAWGRSIMAARASRSRRAVMRDESMKLGEAPAKPKPAAKAAPEPKAEDLPTVAAPASKKRFDFSLGRRKARSDEPSGVFAFKRKPSGAAATPAAAVVAQEAAPPAPAATPERITLRCPSCGTEFTAEGVRPFSVACPSCAFSDTIEAEGHGSTRSPQGS